MTAAAYLIQSSLLVLSAAILGAGLLKLSKQFDDGA
jgi:hypothetical protein